MQGQIETRSEGESESADHTAPNLVMDLLGAQGVLEGGYEGAQARRVRTSDQLRLVWSRGRMIARGTTEIMRTSW